MTYPRCKPHHRAIQLARPQPSFRVPGIEAPCLSRTEVPDTLSSLFRQLTMHLLDAHGAVCMPTLHAITIYLRFLPHSGRCDRNMAGDVAHIASR